MADGGPGGGGVGAADSLLECTQRIIMGAVGACLRDETPIHMQSQLYTCNPSRL